MKAVIMAGGFGTRLRPLTANIPKPMVPMAGKPVMEHIINLLKKHGIEEIISMLYFQSEQIESYFGDGSRWGVKMSYIRAEADFGTAGSVKNAQKYLDDPFIIISGDVLTDFDLTEAINFHRKRKAQATIVLTRVENPLSYGIVITNNTGKITRFLEKPGWGQVFSDTVNTGIYILNPEVLGYIPSKKEFDFSKDLYPYMLSKKMKLFGHVAPGYWRDIGNIEEYYLAHQDVFEGRVNIELSGKRQEYPDAKILVGENTFISHGAQFSGTVVIGDNVKIGPRAKIFQSVIGSNSIIGRDVDLNRVVSWDGVSIGPNAKISEAILCRNAFVGEEAIIEENCILSDHSKVGENCWIKRNVKIWPNKEVEAGAILSTSLIWGERWSRDLFADSKVTGVGNTELTPEFAAKLGAAFGAMIGEGRTVAVCRGPSNAARMLNRAVISGVLSTGVSVNDLQTTPVPVIRRELRSGRLAGGIHTRLNPDGNEEIDMIFFDQNGSDLPTSKSKSIERLFFREDFRRAPIAGTGSIDFPSRVIEGYRESFIPYIEKSVFEKTSPKVVIDYSYGGASEILPGILGELGIDAISLNSFIDQKKVYYFSQFQREALKQLGTIVKSLDCDIGFLLNPGAEKFMAVDEKGDVVSIQKMLLKVTQLYFEVAKPKRIAAPVTASAGLEMIADEFGAQIVWIPSDHQAMMEAAGTEGIDFVVGTKGGFIFPGFQLGVDAMFVTVKILELLGRTGQKLSQVTGDWDRLHMAEKEVACAWGKKGQVMRSLMAHSERAARIIVDGVRISEDDGWVLIRPDRKRAAFYILAESYSDETAKELVKEYVKNIKNWQK
ncbi:MAG TPA: nucleotidyltransferase [candidate division Zixibacteria bacterium]|nr:nucleotidyltransferase [candidate division Zixibacteria bacterium]